MVNFANFTDSIAYFGILGLLTLFLQQDLHFSEVASGQTVGLLTGGVGLCMLFGGSICDFLGVRRAIITSVAVLTVGRGLLAFAPNVPGEAAQFTAIAAIILMALGTGVNQPALYAGMKRYSSGDQSAAAFSLLYSISNLGILLESFMAPYLRTTEPFIGGVTGLGLGLQGVFTVLACTTALSLFALIGLYRESSDVAATPQPETAKEVALGFSPAENSENPDSKVEPAKSEQGKTSWKDFPLFNPSFAFFIFCLLPVRTLFAHQWLTLPTYVFRSFPIEVHSKFEWFNGINPLVVTVCVPLFAITLKRLKVVDAMLIGTALSAGCTMLLVLPPNVNLLVAYLLIFSLGESVWSSRFYEYVGQIAPEGKVGVYMGLAGLPWFIAKTGTSFVSGPMLKTYVPEDGVKHPEQMWLIYALFALSTPVMLLVARNWLLRGEARISADANT
jgi:POT family proton-dependent oligopeptide transporter